MFVPVPRDGSGFSPSSGALDFPSRSSYYCRMPDFSDVIVNNLQTFINFARKRVGNDQLAEDVVQDSLVKALAAEQKPTLEEGTVPWFYRILRRSIIDLYRRNDVRNRAMERFSEELPETADEADEKLLCQCFKGLLPSVPEQYRELLLRIDLEGGEPSEVAASLGITKNNLTVRLHRARKHLRDLLSSNCQACSKHGCLDCTCETAADQPGCH